MSIAPAGGYPPFISFLLQKYSSNLCLEELFEQDLLLTTSSGKSALLAALFALKKVHKGKKVIVPSYGCPDLVTASVRAGFKVELAPVSRETLQMDKGFLLQARSTEYAAIIFANLYGMPDEIPEGIDPEILIIDDLCQSILSKPQRRVGLSIFSAGRGKSICGVGGGGVIYKKGDALADKVFALAKEEVQNWQEQSFTNKIKAILMSILAPTLEKPICFNLISPFLNIGQVVIDYDFAIEKISPYQNCYAAYQYKYSQNINQPWSKNLNSQKVIQPFLKRTFSNPIHLIRYPILLESQEQRDLIVKKLSNLGVSASYKKSLNQYEELKENIEHSSDLKAINGLMTLPVHRYVSQQVVDEIVATLEREI